MVFYINRTNQSHKATVSAVPSSCYPQIFLIPYFKGEIR
ncbi:hypothetical protein PAECIP111890_05770 [Paenibacillus sp. JJ-223]|nr:hypothetical protein PAECIP111890_05770 [Paenibacillus sp. JJ-223]